MGSASSVHEDTLAVEAAKPADASDITTLDEAKAEVARLRALAASCTPKQLAIVVGGANGLEGKDWDGASDPYCVVRIGAAGTTWEQKRPGRKSVVVPNTTDPIWNLGYCVAVDEMTEPELMIRIYDKDFLTDDPCLGDATVKLSDIPPGAPHNVKLEGSIKGSVYLSAGPPTILAELGVKPASIYEDIAPVGTVKSALVSAFADPSTIPMHVGKAPLPPQLRGMFWLTKQDNMSAIMSFGGPTNDGGKCSLGVLGEDGKYVVRVAGDRCWAMASMAKVPRIGQLDLIYNFCFDSATDPRKCQIWPELRTLGVWLTAEWLLDFEMLLTDGDDAFPGSVVWSRPSYLFGKGSGLSSEYALVQVIDEHGAVIQPAFDKFVAFQNSAKAGDSPGTIFYRHIE